MTGERLPDGRWPEKPGDYAKHKTTAGTRWFLSPPVPGVGVGQISPEIHEVIEHEDGTISVTFPRSDGPLGNSILIHGGTSGKSWHGYIERGVWRKC